MTVIAHWFVNIGNESYLSTEIDFDIYKGNAELIPQSSYIPLINSPIDRFGPLRVVKWNNTIPIQAQSIPGGYKIDTKVE